ncbi:hypothetical protein PIB30_025035 [Stylosanthes scabra]|uniref:Uncharacterized protein n=1 Tax=Stylosanthes scabra TaxID=79078 RepID=A0ABU6RA68_9FABA|nr:hypothetical protein [Stylosanthes scabra]
MDIDAEEDFQRYVEELGRAPEPFPLRSSQAFVPNEPMEAADRQSASHDDSSYDVSGVCVARLLCLGKFEELKANSEAEKKKEESNWGQKKLELERELEAVREQNTLKDKELLELKADNEQLKGKLQKFVKEKKELEARVVELCVQKKEAETSKENHGYDMMAAGFERAR